ncbi:hypothetical protein GCM10022419_116870 [Nonomuraea rosea]|uniref:Uncharacterized protein n=1 Tax=Nonomuraea rosea TaxID=638574 RepID=A0ABP6ZKD1_9ACTN
MVPPGTRPCARSPPTGTPVTVNYARVPHGEMRGIPGNIDVAVFHPYVYGVLDELRCRRGDDLSCGHPCWAYAVRTAGANGGRTARTAVQSRYS